MNYQGDMNRELHIKALKDQLNRLKLSRDKLDYFQRGELDFAEILIKTNSYDLADYEQCLSNLKDIVLK